MALSPLFRSWHYVYSCFVSHQSPNTSRVIINMAKCTFSTQSPLPLGQNENAKVELESEGQQFSDSETEVQPSEEDSKKTFLVVGLGNSEHRETRHSIGMNVLDRISKHLKLRWEKENFMKSGGFVAKTDIAPGVELILLKPRVPMNLNGTSVAKTARSYKVLPDNIYVIHDDMDKAVGTFQLKESGSAGGHNGVKSVIHSMRTQDIKRLRIGIDRPDSEDEVIEYVLGRFSFDQELAILPAISSGVMSMFEHIGQQCNVKLDITLSTDPKSLQWNGFKITKPQRQNKYRQNKWDNDSQFERQNFQHKHWDGPHNSGKYGHSRMDKWEDSGDSPRHRSYRFDNDSDAEDFPRKRGNYKSRGFTESEDFPRRRTSKSEDYFQFEDIPRRGRTSRSDFSETDDFPRWRTSKSDNYSESDDFPRRRTSKSEDFSEVDDFPKRGRTFKSEFSELDDFPPNRRQMKSNDFSESSDFPRQRHKRTSRRSNDFPEADVFDDQWNDQDDFNDSPPKEVVNERDSSSRRR